jgi:hypothetical protein
MTMWGRAPSPVRPSLLGDLGDGNYEGTSIGKEDL